MINTNIVIGISGQKQTGKDTVASMINYILYKGITKADYYDWFARKSIYDNQFKYCIIHFADANKDICSILFGIDRKLFDDAKYKDVYFYDLDDKRFIIELTNKHREITIHDLSQDWDLKFFIHSIRNNNQIPCIKLRTILQYIGTEIGRRRLWDDIWVDITLRKISDIILKYKWCIIPDVRFKNEHNGIKKYSAHKTYTIRIERNEIKAEHSSEMMDFDCDVIINNNSTKISLFYKVLTIIKQIIRN